MYKNLFLVFGSVFLCANSAQAASCSDLKSCAKVMFDVTGQRYVWEADAERNKLVMVPGIEITKENAEVVFTSLLDQVHLARAPIGEGKAFRIVPAASRKEMELPVLEASAEHRPSFSNTWDWVTMRYKTKSRELAESIENIYRLHVPREARLQSDYNAGHIIVSASTPVVRQMYETIKAADVPQTPAVKKHLEAQERKWQEQQKNRNK